MYDPNHASTLWTNPPSTNTRLLHLLADTEEIIENLVAIRRGLVACGTILLGQLVLLLLIYLGL